MPIHDWTLVDAGLFHNFHQLWIAALTNALNTGGLPADYFALTDQILGGPIPDVVTLTKRGTKDRSRPSGGVAVADAPLKVRFVQKAEPEIYASRADRIIIQHNLGEIVAVIEIVSPGNKDSRHGLRTFVEKARELLTQGIHLLVVDLFPPSVRDPQGIHKAIWDEIQDEPFELPADKQLTVAAYSAGLVKTAYVEPVAVGDVLPEMPIFLEAERYVPAPLELTYQATWAVTPAPMRELLEPPEA
jgi:hypothetical protein